MDETGWLFVSRYFMIPTYVQQAWKREAEQNYALMYNMPLVGKNIYIYICHDMFRFAVHSASVPFSHSHNGPCQSWAPCCAAAVDNMHNHITLFFLFFSFPCKSDGIARADLQSLKSWVCKSRTRSLPEALNLRPLFFTQSNPKLEKQNKTHKEGWSNHQKHCLTSEF